MTSEERVQWITDSCIDRLMAGENIASILASYPDEAAELWPVLRAAELVMAAPAGNPEPAPRMRAMRRMLDQLERGAAPAPAAGGIAGWLHAFKRRPPLYQGLAAIAAVSVFGALGLGASAATGTTPEPVRDFLRISSNSAIKVELRGIIVDRDGGTLTVDASSDLRTVVVTPSTEITFRDGAFSLDALRPGDAVEVKGALQPDNSIIASRLRVEEITVAPTPAAPRPASSPEAPAVSDGDDTPHEDDRNDDGSGRDDSGRDDGDDETPHDDGVDEPDQEDEPDDHDVTPEPEHEDVAGGDGEAEDETRTPEAEDHDKTPEPEDQEDGEHAGEQEDHPDETPEAEDHASD